MNIELYKDKIKIINPKTHKSITATYKQFVQSSNKSIKFFQYLQSNPFHITYEDETKKHLFLGFIKNITTNKQDANN